MLKVFLSGLYKMENILKMDFIWIRRRFMKVTLIKEWNKGMENFKIQFISILDTFSKICTLDKVN